MRGDGVGGGVGLVGDDGGTGAGGVYAHKKSGEHL